MGGAPCPRQLVKVGEKPVFLGYVNAILFPVGEKTCFPPVGTVYAILFPVGVIRPIFFKKQLWII